MITTQLLAVALVLASCALVALLWVRSKSDGEEPERRVNGIASIAAMAAGGSLALGSVSAVAHAMALTDFNMDAWPPVVRYGIALGVTMYVSLRVLLYGVASALHRWSCRLAKENVDTLGHRLRFGLHVSRVGGLVAPVVGYSDLGAGAAGRWHSAGLQHLPAAVGSVFSGTEVERARSDQRRVVARRATAETQTPRIPHPRAGRPACQRVRDRGIGRPPRGHRRRSSGPDVARPVARGARP